MREIRGYIGQQLNRPASFEAKLVLELLKLIQVMHREREHNRARLRAIRDRVCSWTQGRVKRESQLLWDSRIREALLALERSRRSDLERLPQVLERSILRLTGEVCGEVVQRPEWLRREIGRLLEYLKSDFPYLYCDDSVPLVIAVGKGSKFNIEEGLSKDQVALRSMVILEDETLMPGEIKVSRGGMGFSLARGQVIGRLKH